MPAPTLVFLFHRDLRIVDHNGLFRAVEIAREKGATVLPLFVFTPEQIRRNPLKSEAAVQFMIDSLEDLSRQIREAGGKLVCAQGKTVEILANVPRLIGVLETRDYTPYAKKREADIRSFCGERGILYESIEDMYLTNPGTVKNMAGKTFQKFTPFWMLAKRRNVPKPRGAPTIPWSSARVPGSVSLASMRGPRLLEVPRGGREEGFHCLDSVPANYEEAHDLVMKPTSKLSAHNHFGTLSIREVYWGAPSVSQEAFRRQLYWRDFYGHIMNDFETLYGVGPYEFQVPTTWRKGEKEVFDAWCKGQTGVPFVDAGMREMLTTGFMHNRLRMVVASWLVKDKGVHWRWGERFFAQHLVDYDPAQNMMNWIWVASVLPFASAPFRRHDPERSAKKVDPTGEYQRKWLPENREVK
jgi:deoxyribodipyrimidine photo-lyase